MRDAGAAGKVSIQRDSLGRFMNPWEIPGRGCDLLAGQREYALRFWPASFHTTWNTRETQAPSVQIYFFIRYLGSGIGRSVNTSSGGFDHSQPKVNLDGYVPINVPTIASIRT